MIAHTVITSKESKATPEAYPVPRLKTSGTGVATPLYVAGCLPATRPTCFAIRSGWAAPAAGYGRLWQAETPRMVGGVCS